jgi:hypothetical protein
LEQILFQLRQFDFIEWNTLAASAASAPFKGTSLKMLNFARTARCDNRNRKNGIEFLNQFEIEASLMPSLSMELIRFFPARVLRRAPPIRLHPNSVVYSAVDVNIPAAFFVSFGIDADYDA